MMCPRALSIASGRILAPPRTQRWGQHAQRRLASSDRQPSNVAEFYKNFTRPVAKVLLMAVFTYQLAYWGWVKLEQDETKAEREAEIASLEQKVASLTGYKPTPIEQQPGSRRSSSETPSVTLPAQSSKKEPTTEDYKKQLEELEQRLQAEMLKQQGQPGPEKKSAPWWKVW